MKVRLSRPSADRSLPELLQSAGAEVQLLNCRLPDRRAARLIRWLAVTAPRERIGPLTRALERWTGAGELTFARLAPDQLLLCLDEAAPAVCLATHRAGGFCVACPLLQLADDDAWEIVVPQGKGARRLLERLRGAQDGRFSIAPMRGDRSGARLTQRQDAALRRALDLGYFGYPRRGTLGDVARELGVGRSAALETLRRGTAKLLRDRYGGGVRLR